LREPFSEVTAIDGGKSIRLRLRVGCDEEVGHEMLPRAAGLSIVFEDQSGEVGSGWCDGQVGDGKLPVKKIVLNTSPLRSTFSPSARISLK
jgi:hypothetical protein